MDEVDFANNRMEEELAARIKAARADIPPGVEGECDLCGEWFGRLVNGVCVPCRERHKLD